MSLDGPSDLTADATLARAGRMAKVRDRMREMHVDVLLLSLGADLPWLTGYEAMPLERLTVLVLPVDDDATMVVPELEAPLVDHDQRLFAMRPWAELERPTEIVAGLVGKRTQLAISDRCWAAHLLELERKVGEQCPLRRGQPQGATRHAVPPAGDTPPHHCPLCSIVAHNPCWCSLVTSISARSLGPLATTARPL